MATTPEGKVKAQIKKLLTTHGIYYVMPVSNGMGVHGVPDFLCCVCGFFLAIEAKAGKGKTTALQDEHIARVRKSGGTALVINEGNLQELPDLLSKMKEAYTWV